MKRTTARPYALALRATFGKLSWAALWGTNAHRPLIPIQWLATIETGTDMEIAQAQAVETLRNFIRQRYNVPLDDADFSDDVHLFDYGYIDSFGAVDLIAFVESAFDIKISQSDLVAYPLNTIREIADFALQRRKANGI